ncbi:MAG: hypothetical protein ACFFEV_07590 [Candidatus Thorarchaeota archaeon]
MTMSINEITSFLRDIGFDAITVSSGLTEKLAAQPMIIFDHLSYPGVESHIVTAANCALWDAKLDDTGDVIVYYPESTDTTDHVIAWRRLLEVLSELSGLLGTYRNRVLAGHLPRTIWAHHEIEWYRDLRKAPYHEKQDVSTFIDYVDPSIRKHVTDLNNYGFDTIESCSGLPQDHPNRDAYSPYVMLHERAYPGCIPHFFTLADIADWIPSYAPHNFDVYIRIQQHYPIREAWNRLTKSARILHTLLKSYCRLMRSEYSRIDELDILHDSLGNALVKR